MRAYFLSHLRCQVMAQTGQMHRRVVTTSRVQRHRCDIEKPFQRTLIDIDVQKTNIASALIGRRFNQRN